MAAHVCLKNEFTEDGKCHNLMRWLKTCSSLTYILETNHTLDKPNGSLCQKGWPDIMHWPIFCGPVISSYIIFL